MSSESSPDPSKLRVYRDIFSELISKSNSERVFFYNGFSRDDDLDKGYEYDIIEIKTKNTFKFPGMRISLDIPILESQEKALGTAEIHLNWKTTDNTLECLSDNLDSIRFARDELISRGYKTDGKISLFHPGGESAGPTLYFEFPFTKLNEISEIIKGFNIDDVMGNYRIKKEKNDGSKE